MSPAKTSTRSAGRGAGWLLLLLAVLGLGAGLLLVTGPEPRGQPKPRDPIPGESESADRAVRASQEQPIPEVHASPVDWSAENNRAVALLGEPAGGLKTIQAAVEILERCLEAQPENATFRGNLAEGLVRWALIERDVPETDQAVALARLERAFGLAPERKDLAALIERWRRELAEEAGFSTYGSLYFQISFDGDRSDLLHGAETITTTLDRAYGEFRTAFAFDPMAKTGARLRVVIYRPEAFHRITGLGHWAAGAFDGSLRVPIGDLDQDRVRWERTFRHELVHAFLDSLCGRNLPGWLNEGLAQWHEGPREEQLGLARRLTDAHPLTLQELTGNLGQSGDPDRIAQAYAQALLFTDYLIQNYGDFVLSQVLAGLAAGKTVADAFASAAGIPLADVYQSCVSALAR